MNPDQVFEGFKLWGLGSIAVVIVVLVALTRKVLTFAIPKLKVETTKNGLTKTQTFSSRGAAFYNEIGLYVLPYIYACLIPLVKSEFLFGKLDTYGGKAFYCCLVATFSALIVKVVKKKVPQLFGVKLESDEKTLIESDNEPT